MRPIAIACLLALGAALHPSAVRAQYRRQSGDTLRYREISRTTITLEAPQRTVPLRSLHDATIALAFGHGDTATAWYDTLTLSLQAPSDTISPDTRPALRQPFLLGFDARGRIATRRSPTFPDFQGFTDLTRQFSDFFLRLPPDLVLSPGRTWVDTIIETDSAPAGWSNEFRRIVECQVVGDTALSGRQARTVRAHQTIRLTSIGPVPGQALTARSELAGEDDGIFVFATAPGLLLARSREGHLSGTIVYEGGPQPLTVRQRFDYTNRIDLLP